MNKQGLAVLSGCCMLLAVACGQVDVDDVNQMTKEQVTQCTNGGCEPFAIECFAMGNVPMCLYSRSTYTPTSREQLLCDWAAREVDWFCDPDFLAKDDPNKCFGNWRHRLCEWAEQKLIDRCFWVPTSVCVEPQTAVDNFNNLPDACFGTCGDITACNNT